MDCGCGYILKPFQIVDKDVNFCFIVDEDTAANVKYFQIADEDADSMILKSADVVIYFTANNLQILYAYLPIYIYL